MAAVPSESEPNFFERLVVQFELKLLYQRPLYPGQNGQKNPLISRLHHSCMCFVGSSGYKNPCYWLGTHRSWACTNPPSQTGSNFTMKPQSFRGNGKTALALNEFDAFFSNDTFWSFGENKKMQLGTFKKTCRRQVRTSQPLKSARYVTSPFAGHHVSAWSLSANI